MVKQIRVGIAGTGFAGRFHLENYPEAGVEVAGVTSARPESREAFAAKHGVPTPDKAKYEAFTQEAVGRSVFGAPTYIYKDEMFWGQDRLEFLERALQK